MYKDAESLAAAMLSASKGNTTEWPGQDPPVLSALFEIDPVSGSGSLTIGYNKERLRSARAAVSEVINATVRLSSAAALRSDAFPDGLGCSYLFWRSPLYSNGLGAGALALIFSQAFNVIAILYCMDMVRMRVSRVKEMLLLSGAPLTRLLYASYTPLTRLLHASYTPVKRILNACDRAAADYLLGIQRARTPHALLARLWYFLELRA
jgi:hypothetical protein